MVIHNFYDYSSFIFTVKYWLYALCFTVIQSCSLAGKESTYSAGDCSSIPGLGRSTGEGIGYPLQCSWASLVVPTVKNSPAMGDLGLIPGLRRSAREGNGYPLEYSCLENTMDRGAWQAIVHEVTKSWTQLSNFHIHTYIHPCSLFYP